MKSEEISVHHSKSLCCLRPPVNLKITLVLKKQQMGAFLERMVHFMETKSYICVLNNEIFNYKP